MADRYVLAIDPGTTESAYCIVRRSDYKPMAFDKLPNTEINSTVMDKLYGLGARSYDFVIEMVASYGMPVGREVFETCVWVGRFIEQLAPIGRDDLPIYSFVYRQDEKMGICHDQKANDATIKQALVDRFAYGTGNHGKGSKKEPGWFHGFKADVWSSYACAVTFIDREDKEQF